MKNAIMRAIARALKLVLTQSSQNQPSKSNLQFLHNKQPKKYRRTGQKNYSYESFQQNTYVPSVPAS